MSLGVFNSAAFLTASQLAVAAGATVEVRRESDSGLASIFSDRAGTAAITNPSAFADASGRFTFYVEASPGGFSIEVTSGAESFMLRNVPIGLGQEFDIVEYWRAVLASATEAAALAALGTYSDGAVDAAILASVSAKHISGLTYANNATDATNDLDIAAGSARDATNALNITLASALTKQSDVAWAVGTAAGGLDTGAVGNSDYYIWLIKRSDTGVVDVLFSLSSTAPTMPANYDYKRLIGWFKRVAGTIVAFKTYETEGGGIEHLWNSPTLDINLANTLTTSRRTDAVKVPLNFSVIAILNMVMFDASSAVRVYISCPDVADLAPGASAPFSSMPQSLVTSASLVNYRVRTGATGLIASRADVATVDTYQAVTVGFNWARRN